MIAVGLVFLAGCATTSASMPSDPLQFPIRKTDEPDRFIKDRLALQEREQKQRSVNLPLVRSLIETKQYALAQTYLDQALKTETDSTEVYRLLGVVHREKKEFESARPMFQKALKQDPESAAAHNDLGILLLMENEIVGGNRSFLKATELMPLGSRYYNNLGFSFYLMGDLTRAVEAYEKAVRLDASIPRYHNNLGYAYGMIKRYPEALREFLQGGTEATAYNNLGFSYQADGQLDQARDLYRKALEIDPSLKTARQNLAALCRSRTIEDGACFSQDGNEIKNTEAP